MEMKTILDFALVAAGGALGAMARFAVSNVLNRDNGWPAGTLLVNLLGCFAIGMFYGWGVTAKTDRVRHFVCSGILGSLTTMSAFSAEVVGISERGQRLFAAGYVVLSVAGCLLAALCGVLLARWFAPAGAGYGNGAG